MASILDVGTNYEYAPLNPDRQEIRLFELLPKSQGNPLRGHLRVVSLNDNPRFEALSYVWGYPAPRFEVKIGDSSQSLLIAKNLWKALNDIQDETRSITIWIDGVCINQKDLAERSSQVQFMRHIYSHAAVVKVWLDLQIDPGLDVFADISKMEELEIEGRPSDYWMPLCQVRKNRHWTRLWIQQEVTLASKLLIYCRGNVLDGHGFLLFDKKLDLFLRDVWKGVTVPSPDHRRLYDWVKRVASTLFQYIASGREMLSLKLNPNETLETLSATSVGIPEEMYPLSLLSLFLAASELQRTDSRDRLYGLLGLAINVEPGDIAVDYTRENVEVYAQLFRHCITKHDSLAFLMAVSPTPLDLFEYPSWFPSMEWPELWGAEAAISTASGNISAASSGASIDDAGKILRVRGRCIDRIGFKLPGETPVDEKPASQWIDELSQFCTHLGLPGASPADQITQDPVLSLLFPWASDAALVWGKQPPLNQGDKRRIAAKLCAVSAADAALSLSSVIYFGNDHALLSAADRAALGQMTRALLGRSFVGTEQRRLLGLVDNRGQMHEVGDEVWVLLGCRMPVLLRPVRGWPGRYVRACTLIVPGLMEGEACEGILESGEAGLGYDGPPVQSVEIV